MKAELKKLFSNKAVRAATIGGLALLLLVAVWAVFFGSEKKSASAYQPTEAESRLCTVLERIEGAPVSAVVVFEGADSLLTRMRVAEVTAAALNIARGNVQVYPSKDK